MQKIFANHVSEKGLISRLHKRTLTTQLQKDKQPNLKMDKGFE